MASQWRSHETDRATPIGFRTDTDDMYRFVLSPILRLVSTPQTSMNNDEAKEREPEMPHEKHVPIANVMSLLDH